jgi:hypothetical protein
MDVLGPLSAGISKTTSARYAAAFGAIALALLTRWALNPVLGERVPYVTLFPAVVFSAYFCGLGPSIVAVILGFAGASWFISPVHFLRNPDLAASIGGLAFLLASGITVAIGNSNLPDRARMSYKHSSAFRQPSGDGTHLPLRHGRLGRNRR